MRSMGTTGLAIVFLIGGAVTWVAGSFLSDGTDAIDDRFHLGQAIGGLILLGLAGTLPEIAITVSAALNGNLGLATGNLLGGVAMQTLVLVLLDAASGSPIPLSSLSKVLEPLVEALLVVLLVSLALLGPLLPPSASIGPVSPVSILIAVAWLVGLAAVDRLSKDERWETVAEHIAGAVILPAPEAKEGVRPNRFEHSSTRVVIVGFGAAALATLLAGVILEQSGSALADRWGINGVVFGATILAAVTSLPEISSGIRAVRLGEVGLAMGDIFGGNQVQMTLFLVADLLARKPVLHTVSTSSIWLGGLGVIVTAIYAAGLVVRPRRKVLGVGPDSALVVLAYALGVWGLAVIAN